MDKCHIELMTGNGSMIALSLEKIAIAICDNHFRHTGNGFRKNLQQLGRRHCLKCSKAGHILLSDEGPSGNRHFNE